MPTIKSVLNEYRGKIDALDLDLLIASVIDRPRGFVLAHPEYKIPATHTPKLIAWIKRRIKHEPIAYILGQKEFYGLSFNVNKHTLIPRPETELLVEESLKVLRSMLRNKLRNTIVADIGTGSGNIIISVVKNLSGCGVRITGCEFYGIDISEKALAIAKQNSKQHKVNRNIKFLKGNLLDPLLKSNKLMKLKDSKLVIVANLPYLSKKIYASTPRDVKKYEPRSALLSGKNGLDHYKELFKQINGLLVVGCRLSVFLEISPEQKKALQKLLRISSPAAKTTFYKDLAGKWRLARITLP